MTSTDSSAVQPHSKAVRLLIILVAITGVLSLLYALQYYVGGPVRLPVVDEIHAVDIAPDGRWIAGGDASGDVLIWVFVGIIVYIMWIVRYLFLGYAMVLSSKWAKNFLKTSFPLFHVVLACCAIGVVDLVVRFLFQIFLFPDELLLLLFYALYLAQGVVGIQIYRRSRKISGEISWSSS